MMFADNGLLDDLGVFDGGLELGESSRRSLSKACSVIRLRCRQRLRRGSSSTD
jgi:hypothetical protein